jgi:hypothetical protein
MRTDPLFHSLTLNRSFRSDRSHNKGGSARLNSSTSSRCLWRYLCSILMTETVYARLPVVHYMSI